MLQALSTGESDETVAICLPTTQGFFAEEYENELDNLGDNLTDTQVGVIVPEYVDIDSIEDLPAFDEQ